MANRYYVKRFELAGLAPQNFFRFTTNSKGTTASATDFTVSRKSQTVASGFSDYPEFDNYIQNPDPDYLALHRRAHVQREVGSTVLRPHWQRAIGVYNDFYGGRYARHRCRPRRHRRLPARRARHSSGKGCTTRC